ncbi:hypothetical protein [Devosia sp. SD17-2]|jgi:hypothetical protein|uniref:hypothetical protein n=1 Tax=Devosia sp. SD17-2 TaxID=2976459 RepID=UPI0023D888D0|nr:hypothetical protein [Devosia sp. SD17-2]WEJ33882.1 hypothetical protein NYQ88_03445 [Devosia sp. SD17-2]
MAVPTDRRKAKAPPVTIERIERAMDEVALAIHMAGAKGAVYLPIYERLERELQALREKQATMALVRARLERLAAQ